MKVKFSRVFMYVFLSVASVLSLFPLVWTVISATNTNADILRGTLVPGTHLVQNFIRLTELTDLGRAFWNSARNAVLATFVSIVICSLAGYGFEIYHSKAKDRLMGVLLLSMMIPFAAVMVPLFQLIANLSLLNTTLGFMLPTLSTAFLIMLFRQNTRAFPLEMIEAARIDGLNELSIFIRIYIPTMKSTYAAAVTITFMATWNVFLWPRIIMISPDSVTMPLLISNLMAGYVADFGVIMLAVTIATLPTVLLFFFLQRYFAEGMTGTIK